MLLSITITACGRWIYNVGIAAFVYEQTRSPGWLAVLAVGRYVPALVLSPVAAVSARRWPLRAAIVTCDVLAAAVVGAMVLVAGLHAPVAAVVLLASLASGVTRTRLPVTSAYLLELVDEAEMARANAALRSTESAALLVGPLVGSALVALGDPTVALAVTAVAYAVSGLAVLTLPPARHGLDADATHPVVGALRQGLHAVASAAGRPYVAVAALSSFGFGVDTVLLVVLAQGRHLGASGYGLLLAGAGLGGLLAVPAVDRLCRTRHLGVLAAAALAGYALPTVLLLVVRSPVAAVLLMVPRGAGALVAEAVALTGLQRTARTVPISRLLVGFNVVLLGALVLGAAAAPLVERLAGLTGMLLLAGAALPVVVVAVLPSLVDRDRTGQVWAGVLRRRVDVLEQLGIFAGARLVTLERLSAAMSERTVEAGTVLLEQGAAADVFLVLTSGSADVLVDGRYLRTVQAPTHVGEIGLLRRSPRTATVVAATPVDLLVADGESFLSALTDAPVSPALTDVVVSRLARSSRVPLQRPQDDLALDDVGR